VQTIGLYYTYHQLCTYTGWAKKVTSLSTTMTYCEIALNRKTPDIYTV